MSSTLTATTNSGFAHVTHYPDEARYRAETARGAVPRRSFSYAGRPQHEALEEAVAYSQDGLIVTTPRSPRAPLRLAGAHVKREAGETYVVNAVENTLVCDYWDYMSARGVKLDTEVPCGPYFIDLYDEATGTLIEAKRAANYTRLRYALGQIQDYLLDAPAERLAVLTPERPDERYERLLGKFAIACIWRSGEGFEDNAGGTYS